MPTTLSVRPADRFIIATALTGNLAVVTSDRSFPRYGIEVVKT